MVDVGAKPVTDRRAVAQALVRMKPETAALVEAGDAPKGDVVSVARIAGIQAAKQTAQLIPLCHPLGLSHIALDLTSNATAVEATCTARTTAQTGVEMEALTGVTGALLTIYDMCKAVDKQMRIGEIRLLKKTKSAVAPRPHLSSRSGEARRGTSQLQ